MDIVKKILNIPYNEYEEYKNIGIRSGTDNDSRSELFGKEELELHNLDWYKKLSIDDKLTADLQLIKKYMPYKEAVKIETMKPELLVANNQLKNSESYKKLDDDYKKSAEYELHNEHYDKIKDITIRPSIQNVGIVLLYILIIGGLIAFQIYFIGAAIAFLIVCVREYQKGGVFKMSIKNIVVNTALSFIYVAKVSVESM